MMDGALVADGVATSTRDVREAVADFIARHPRLFVLTGAGCSTGSGIPDYRDRDGAWKRKPPVTDQDFRASALVRARYWARSMIGWPTVGHAQPNDAHRALAALEARGRLPLLVTQNVDGLHQKAGHRGVIDLHGRIDAVVCLACGMRSAREELQARLLEANPAWVHLTAGTAPDGDADLDGLDFSTFAVPPCTACGGLLKPDVVFFGANVPRGTVEAAMAGLAAADGMLVVGSSLMVFSGYRFADVARKAGIPIAAVNLGVTRADPILSLKAELPAAALLGISG
ncbi:MAG TPA: NAD-dependent protein deacetylase [Nevskiaceae bacterium]|nr:NAD-dependent protein deacetylase [Nevskiaceae bacterium]